MTHPTPECWFCGDNRGADAQPPGGWIYRDDEWQAGHKAIGEIGPPGLVILESQRHFLDLAEMNDREAATLGPVIGRVTAAIKQVTGAERVYTWSTMRAHPHLHLWLIPWHPDAPQAGIAYVAEMNALQCTSEQAMDTAHRLRDALAGG